MDFPAYVPLVVQKHIESLINEDAWEPHGWEAALASVQRELDALRAKMATLKQHPSEDPYYLDALIEEEANKDRYRTNLERDLACLNRLGHDDRMREVFSLLINELHEDQRLSDFIYAAWAAQMDYGEPRERLRKVGQLNEKIEKAAENLAHLLRTATTIGFDRWPSAFFSVRELLRTTENHADQGHNLYMWRAMRYRVLGELPPKKANPPSPDPNNQHVSPPRIQLQVIEPGEKVVIDPVEQARNTLRYAWGTAPDLAELIETAAMAARSFKPQEDRMIGAALRSRKQNEKTEYLRAFGYLLSAEHQITLTPGIMNAIALTATVVLNSPDIDVTFDDVRKALAQLG